VDSPLVTCVQAIQKFSGSAHLCVDLPISCGFFLPNHKELGYAAISVLNVFS